MPNLKFQVAPDVRKSDGSAGALAKSEDIPIDSLNISKQLALAGIDVPVKVNHKTGEITIGVDKLSTAQQNTVKALIRSMPQYMRDMQ